MTLELRFDGGSGDLATLLKSFPPNTMAVGSSEMAPLKAITFKAFWDWLPAGSSLSTGR